MTEKLTKKEKAFADEYLDTGNGTQSALKAYNATNDNSAAVEASRTLRKAKVQAYLEEKAEKAAEVIFSLMYDSEQDSVKLGAAKDIMDRSGYKPVDKSMALNLNADIEIKPENRELIDKFEQALKDSLS